VEYAALLDLFFANMPLVQFTDMTTASNTAQISAMNTYFTYPLVSLVFGVSVVIAGIYAIVRIIHWMTAKIAHIGDAKQEEHY